jgi:hypothetical protein
LTLSSLGVKENQVLLVSAGAPQLFNIPPCNLDWLVKHGIKFGNLKNVVRKCPQLAELGIEEDLDPLIKWLVHQGVGSIKSYATSSAIKKDQAFIDQVLD